MFVCLVVTKLRSTRLVVFIQSRQMCSALGSLVIISGLKNTILEQQGDTVGNLVRDVSIHTSQNVVVAFSFCVLKSSHCAKTVLMFTNLVTNAKHHFRHGTFGKTEGCVSLSIQFWVTDTSLLRLRSALKWRYSAPRKIQPIAPPCCSSTPEL
jgi:hypothetical protein